MVSYVGRLTTWQQDGYSRLLFLPLLVLAFPTNALRTLPIQKDQSQAQEPEREMCTLLDTNKRVLIIRKRVGAISIALKGGAFMSGLENRHQLLAKRVVPSK